MTIKEQIIFNGLLKETNDLSSMDTSNVVAIQIQDHRILIWWKDPEDNFKLKLIDVYLPVIDDFLKSCIKDHRDLAIEHLID